MGEKPLQAVLSIPARPPLLAGVPAAVRTARRLAERGSVLLCAQDRDSLAAWKPRLAGFPIEEFGSCNGSNAPRERLDPAAPLLLLAPDGYPEPEALERFLAESEAAPGASLWLSGGRVVAAYHREARSWLERLDNGAPDLAPAAIEAAPPGSRRTQAPAQAWRDLRNPEALARAEEAFFRSLRSDADGYLARLDRSLSIAVSRRLIHTPVTPNQITAFSLLVGLAGAALLAWGGHAASVAGAALLWSCCVLDGCDGEVARLKLLSSPWGARFDVIADNVVHVAIFVAIPIHLGRLHPDMRLSWPFGALLAGVFASMLAVWLLILRRPGSETEGLPRVYERIASRDFIYLVAALTVVERLEWFLWAAAVGANLFWISLILVSRSRKPSSR